MILRRVILFLMLIMLLAGCWNRRELNELAIATALSIDKDGENYKISVQIINPAEVASQSKTNRTPVTTFSESAPTIFEALRKLTTVSPRKIYLSHLRTVVIGEELAKEGIANVLDFLNRDHEMRTDFFILIAKGQKGAEVLEILTPTESIPANKMYSSLKSSEKAYAATYHVTLDNLVYTLISKGKEPVITGIKVLGDKEVGKTQKNVERIKSKAFLKYEGLAIFKNEKLVGWLNEAESKGFNYIIGNVSNTVGNVECPNDENGKVVLEVLRIDSNISANIENKKPKIIIDLWAEGSIGEVNCPIEIRDPTIIKAIEKKAEEKVKLFLDKVIAKAKEENVDMFGFGEVIHREDYEVWNKLKENWSENFAALEVEVKVNYYIRRTGTTGNSFLNQLKE